MSVKPGRSARPASRSAQPLRMRPWAVLAATALLATLPAVSPAPAAGVGQEERSCAAHDVRVGLEPGDAPRYQVAGALCWRGELAGRSVLVLVHGITHSHLNWDLRFEPERYSYVDAFTRAGYATFHFDRIGTGASDRPAAAEVTLESNAFVLHQIVAGLRSGAVGGTASPRVALVGHSYGAAVSEAEAGRYRDVDAVVALSALHSVDPGALSIVFANHVPDQTDSRFRNAGLPPGYLTTREGVRGELFYEPTNSDPEVVALDEATKQTDTSGEWGTLAQFVSPPAAQTVEVPVFIAVGDRFRKVLSGESPGHFREHGRSWGTITGRR